MVNFQETIAALRSRMEPCVLCPHRCGAKRLSGEKGKCGLAAGVFLSSHNLHSGEEPPISGSRGSGTLFFTRCNLSCVFCQNYPISQLGHGNETSARELASFMLGLQEEGAHNINFVTPSPVVPHIAEAVMMAREQGLTIPLAYNCGGYEDVETLRLLDGIIDIYLPDAKYAGDDNARTYSGAPGYWEINKKALKEMHRQVGTLTLSEDGIARKGLLIRHLVLPGDIAGSEEVLTFIAKEISPDTYLSLMAQYHPAHKTAQYPELNRRITEEEYNVVLGIAERLGLENGWQQGF